MGQAQVVSNWSNTYSTKPSAIHRPSTRAELVGLVSDPQRYPSPVRAIGHYHSTTDCGDCEGGTLIDMTAMDRIVEITDDHITVEAGALYQDVAKQLAKHGKNFFINLQVGPVTLGSLACCASKDASAPGEFGQFAAYVEAFQVVMADGTVHTIDQSDGELFSAMRSSYGLLGIVVEVTFRITQLAPLAVEHLSFSTTRFIEQLPMLKQQDASMMLYIYPFADRVMVMLRRPGDPQKSRKRWVWWLRNNGVAWGLAPTARIISWLPGRFLRYWSLQVTLAISRWVLEHWVMAKNTNPVEQATNYPRHTRLASFSFSMFAFPEEIYPQVLLAYKRFCEAHYERYHYRPDLLNVGYRISQSQHSTFSYSYDGDVMTIDPVGTGGPEWERFILSFNDFCLRYGGWPLFNQSPALNHQHVAQVFGKRLVQFKLVRTKIDPGGRFLNNHFRELLGI